MQQTYAYNVDDGATVQMLDDGSAVVPRIVRSGTGMAGPEWSAWALVVGSVVVLALMRRSFRKLIPGS